MANIFLPGSSNSSTEMIVSKAMDDFRQAFRNVYKDSVFVKLTMNVLGNSEGEIKTSGPRSIKADGSSLKAGFGSQYCVGNITLVFPWEYVRDNVDAMAEQVARIQNKFSFLLTGIQGNVSKEVEMKLRESAMRSQACRQAREDLTNDYPTMVIDSATMSRANKNVRAGVLSDMSLELSVSSSFLVDTADTERAKWAESKGYKLNKSKGIYTMFAKEKGLKKVYLLSAGQVTEAQRKVYNLAKTAQDQFVKIAKPAIDKAMASKLDEDAKLVNPLIAKLLDEISKEMEGNVDGEVKQIAEFTEEELTKIAGWKKEIVDNYLEEIKE